MKKIFLALVLILMYGCMNEKSFDNLTLVNSKHLDHLYEEINSEDQILGIIHIYAEYPDYHFVGAENEGIACIDDVTRALVFYIKDFEYNGTKESLRKSKQLIQFILHLEAEDSTYYNFIFDDGRINKTFKTSISGFQWWMWRALWAMAESYETIKKDDESLANEMLTSLHKGFAKTTEHFKSSNLSDSENGITFPNWLPGQSGADQTAVLILSLSSYYKINKSDDIVSLIQELSNSILKMQLGSKEIYPYGAFLSWRNVWHAWGNSQSYALLKAYEITKNETYLNSALQELNGYYTYLTENKYFNEIFFKRNNKVIENISTSKYPQIAYGIRPMVFACLEAYKITNNKKYATQAGRITQWLFGYNELGKSLYDEKTGRCFDGISSSDKINMNSGAESTIEALLTLIEIEQNQISKNTLLDYIQKGK